MKKKPAKKTPKAKRPPMALPLRVGLFALMFLAVVMIGARINDIVRQIAHGQTPSAFTPLKAEEAPPAAPLPTAAPDKKTEDKKPEDIKPADVKAEVKADEKKVDPAPAADAKPADAAKPDDKKADAPAASPTAPGPTPDADAKPAAGNDASSSPTEDSSLDTPELSESEINVLRHLSERRKDLDKKSSQLDQRETLLNLTEQRVDKKIADLKSIQDQIRKVLGEADAEHKAQVASMVKIYETMKAKDAARIFDTMDMPTLVEVASRMKEAKAAPVLAAMDAGKAKELSTALMTKKTLPAAP